MIHIIRLEHVLLTTRTKLLGSGTMECQLVAVMMNFLGAKIPLWQLEISICMVR